MKNDKNAIDHPRSDALNCLAGGLRLRQCDMLASVVVTNQISERSPSSGMICTNKRRR